jgi:hypothetical protein
VDRSILLQILRENFSESELEDLCFDLGVDYEILGGNNKLAKARELIEYMERVGRYPELVQRAYDLRPKAPWPESVKHIAAAASASATFTWQSLLTSTRQQAERFLREAQGSLEQPNIFIPALYTRRAAVEQTFKTFLASPATALILQGDPGVGKTNLLCQLALDLTAENHGVFY